MATQVTVTYEDGREDAIQVLPIGYVLAERHFAGRLPPLEGTLYAAWATLRPEAKYDEWLASLTSATEEVVESPGPLDEAASPGP